MNSTSKNHYFGKLYSAKGNIVIPSSNQTCFFTYYRQELSDEEMINLNQCFCRFTRNPKNKLYNNIANSYYCHPGN